MQYSPMLIISNPFPQSLLDELVQYAFSCIQLILSATSTFIFQLT